MAAGTICSVGNLPGILPSFGMYIDDYTTFVCVHAFLRLPVLLRHLVRQDDGDY